MGTVLVLMNYSSHFAHIIVLKTHEHYLLKTIFSNGHPTPPPSPKMESHELFMNKYIIGQPYCTSESKKEISNKK